MTPSWRQINVRFDDWDTVEHTALTRLGPALTKAEQAGLIDSWFFMRKAEPPNRLAPHGVVRRPCWRVRILAPTESAASDALAFLDMHLPAPAPPAVYEPEVHAFGGEAGIALAHTLFHQDSRYVLTYLGLLGADDSLVGRRELAMLLASRLFRAAGQDWYEQGDIWARIAQNRQPTTELPPEKVRSLQPAVHRLMTVDTADLVRDTSSGLAFAADGFAVFDHVGKQLAQLARDGLLQRGIRAVLAHHVLFTFNRWGLSHESQTLLAHTASRLVFD